MSEIQPSLDPRKRRTRQDLLASFLSLAMSRRYQDIRVADILDRASVSRSTFYEHFGSKDEVLAASFEEPFRAFAGLAGSNADTGRVQAILEHFWSNRALARHLFHGAAARALRVALIDHVQASIRSTQDGEWRIPTRLAAHCLADAMLSPVLAWLSGEAKCTAPALAEALRLSTAASLNALRPMAGHADRGFEQR